MKLKEIKGLKYPDDYFIKFFFKNELHTKSDLTYLEFGCGNGNNLLLAYEYGNNVIGVDYSNVSIENANYNFQLSQNKKFNFFTKDMREFVQISKNINADVLSLPNIINYIKKTDFIKFLTLCRDNKLYKKEANFFIRFRGSKDFRFGVGKRISNDSYQIEMDNNMTGEAGALNCFYTEVEMIDILRKYLNINNYKLFHIDFENIACNGDIVFNSDIVIWGTIG